jgi:hypothetical protein
LEILVEVLSQKPITMKNFLLSVLAVGILNFMQSQAVWTVDNNATSGAQFTSVQAAIDAAAPGDFVHVHPSPDSYGDITINKTIHIRGLGHYPELNTSEIAKIGSVGFSAPLGAPNSSISGVEILQIQGFGAEDYSGFQITNNKITNTVFGNNAGNTENWLIQGNAFISNSTQVISPNYSDNWVIVNNYIQNATTSFSWVIFQSMNSSTVIRNNVIFSHVNDASPWLYNDCIGLEIENCIFLFSQAAATSVGGNNATVNYNNCLLYNYSGQTMNELPGGDNLANVDPMFMNDGGDPWFTYSDNYNLDPSSPAYQYGTDGQDLGIYGNDIQFSMEGYPNDLPFPTGMTISSTQVTNGGTLEVEFKAKGN